MGTRNLTMVIDKEGVIKVAQYGQWDGYPSGVGVGVLSFLQDEEKLKALKENLPKCRFFEPDGKDKEFSESYDKNTPQWSHEPDNRSEEQIKWFELFASRDLAESILTNIAESVAEEIILLDRQETAKGDGWVEWSYIINLKENTLSVHSMIDLPPIKVYQLDNLPDEEGFINELEYSEED